MFNHGMEKQGHDLSITLHGFHKQQLKACKEKRKRVGLKTLVTATYVQEVVQRHARDILPLWPRHLAMSIGRCIPCAGGGQCGPSSASALHAAWMHEFDFAISRT
eukprot:1152275-Pelagomonas_calceolata.AAC.3